MFILNFTYVHMYMENYVRSSPSSSLRHLDLSDIDQMYPVEDRHRRRGSGESGGESNKVFKRQKLSEIII